MGDVSTEKVWVRIRKIGTAEWTKWEVHDYWHAKDIRKEYGGRVETIPAYSFLDMLGVLPTTIPLGKGIVGYKAASFRMQKLSSSDGAMGRFRFAYIISDDRCYIDCARDYEDLVYSISDNIISPTEALAKLIIWLGENGYIKEVE
jgi:hypothetical protein